MTKKYKVQIDREVYECDDYLLYACDILRLAGRRDDDFAVNVKYHGKHDRKRLERNEAVRLEDPTIQRFEVMKIAATGGG